MEKTKRVVIKIKGMTCEHCVMVVTKVIEKFPELTDISVEVGKAEFTAPIDFDPFPVGMAIEEKGYDVVE